MCRSGRKGLVGPLRVKGLQRTTVFEIKTKFHIVKLKAEGGRLLESIVNRVKLQVEIIIRLSKHEVHVI